MSSLNGGREMLWQLLFQEVNPQHEILLFNQLSGIIAIISSDEYTGVFIQLCTIIHSFPFQEIK